MKLSLTPAELVRYVARQADNFFPDDRSATVAIAAAMDETLGRVEHCFKNARLKGFGDAQGPIFAHLHTDQYAIFLYFLSNTIYRRAGSDPAAAKIYALNKALHGLDAFYEVSLPDVFAVVHPVGTVLGRASYSDFFCVYQNCAVGSDPEGNAPQFGRGVVLYAGSRVIGRAAIGANCLVSAGTVILGGTVPPDSVVFGQHPAVGHKPTRHRVIRDVFKAEI